MSRDAQQHGNGRDDGIAACVAGREHIWRKGRCVRCNVEQPRHDELASVSMPETLAGLPDDLAHLIRDPSIIVPQDAAVFKLVAKWMDAPTGTLSAMSVEEWRQAWSVTCQRMLEAQQQRDELQRRLSFALRAVTWFYDDHVVEDDPPCPCGGCERARKAFKANLEVLPNSELICLAVNEHEALLEVETFARFVADHYATLTVSGSVDAGMARLKATLARLDESRLA